MATIRYLAFISERPEELAKFYERYLGTQELGRSPAGDISITDGFLNLTLFKKRPALCEPRMETGLNHVGIQVESVEQAKNRYLKLFPRGPVIPEDGDLQHGAVRIHDPDGNPVSLSEKPFGVIEERRIPGIRHIAYNAMDPEGMREFYSEVFGFVEVPSGFEYRKAGKLNRFVGDGHINLAIHPFYNSGSKGHEMRFGINHIGFLVPDLKATMEDVSSVVKVNKRPDDRPYAEYRITDPEGNRLDLSQSKGWEVWINQWERVA